MTDTINATAERLRRMDDNEECTPLELLELVADDIKRGTTTGERMIVVCVGKDPKDEVLWNCTVYRSNMTRVQEIGYLELAKTQSMENWRNDD